MENNDKIKNGKKIAQVATAGGVTGVGLISIIWTMINSLNANIDELRNELDVIKERMVIEITKNEDYHRIEIEKLNTLIDEMKYHSRRRFRDD